jgi:hypothetical protein
MPCIRNWLEIKDRVIQGRTSARPVGKEVRIEQEILNEKTACNSLPRRKKEGNQQERQKYRSEEISPYKDPWQSRW